jgi:serine/threonine protein kinase
MSVAKRPAFIQLTWVRQRLFREIKLWLKLEHENIVPLWGVTDEFGSLPALVSPWLENGSLTAYLQHKHETLFDDGKFALVRSDSRVPIFVTLMSL